MNRIFNRSSEQMPELPDASVHCVVTSPPYYGLRDYGTATWDGGDLTCDHAVRKTVKTESSTLGGGKKTTGHQREGFKGTCGRCGAVRIDPQIGLEPTLNEYIAKLVSCAREWRRVLRKDGTVWLNLGDSYAQQGGSREYGSSDSAVGRANGIAGLRKPPAGFKPKDLMLVPHRVAIALQEDGWWVRDAIVWAKPNPMPSSVTDRCTPSYELVFHLAKSKTYYADMESVKEPTVAPVTNWWGEGERPESVDDGQKRRIGTDGRVLSAATSRSIPGGVSFSASGANLRNVWTIATEPYAGAHFAVMPRELVRRCILIGCPPGGVVLDPFMGSGTVAEVAVGCGRQYVGYELNPEYCKLIQDRLGLFGEGVA